jgi:hypothetical protein
LTQVDLWFAQVVPNASKFGKTMDAAQSQREGSARGGRSKSDAKIAASRQNGKRGGRPQPTLAVLIRREMAKQVAATAKAKAREDAAIARAAKRLAPKPKPPKPLNLAARIVAAHYGWTDMAPDRHSADWRVFTRLHPELANC